MHPLMISRSQRCPDLKLTCILISIVDQIMLSPYYVGDLIDKLVADEFSTISISHIS